ncbi:hypothetical protein B0H14DRAFT_2579240 [Mycena olivaceomarginata]|nr:hypothetical protein B0H14DRAFT_2579240 [Mycena olivaceomarginata]
MQEFATLKVPLHHTEAPSPDQSVWIPSKYGSRRSSIAERFAGSSTFIRRKSLTSPRRSATLCLATALSTLLHSALAPPEGRLRQTYLKKGEIRLTPATPGVGHLAAAARNKGLTESRKLDVVALIACHISIVERFLCEDHFRRSVEDGSAGLRGMGLIHGECCAADCISGVVLAKGYLTGTQIKGTYRYRTLCNLRHIPEKKLSQINTAGYIGWERLRIPSARDGCSGKEVRNRHAVPEIDVREFVELKSSETEVARMEVCNAGET